MIRKHKRKSRRQTRRMDGLNSIRLERIANITTYLSVRVRKTELVKVLLSNV